LQTGEIIDVKHLPPDKILIEKDRLILHNKFNEKMLSMETNRFSNPRIPFQMFGRFKYSEFSFSDETKTLSGVFCKKGWSVGDTGDTTIIWIPKDTSFNSLKSIFNFLFVKPPKNPVLEIAFKNFRMTDAKVEELKYSVYSIETGDYTKTFQDLKTYQRVSQEEYMLQRDSVCNAVYEQYKKEKGNNK
jgi:hypothetical protein